MEDIPKGKEIKEKRCKSSKFKFKPSGLTYTLYGGHIWSNADAAKELRNSTNLDDSMTEDEKEAVWKYRCVWA